MNWKFMAVIALLLAGTLVGVKVALKKHSQPAVTVTIRIAVSPETQVDFVVGRGNSAQFKYLVGKQSGVKPVLAQKLSFKPVPHSAFVEARIGVLTQEEGRRYEEVFLETLQALCGNQAQLAVAEQSIH
jgi:hypothetical protein